MELSVWQMPTSLHKMPERSSHYALQVTDTQKYHITSLEESKDNFRVQYYTCKHSALKQGCAFCFLYLRTPVVLICWDQLEVKHVLFWLQAAGIHLHHRNTLRTSVIKSRCICRELFSHKHTQAQIMPEEKHLQMNMYSKAEKKIHEMTEQNYQLKCLCTPTHS